MRSRRPKMLPMTMPAMAPPERPELDVDDVCVTFIDDDAPVAIGVPKGTVVVVEKEVCVTTPVPEDVGLRGAEGEPAGAHWPETWQYWPLGQQMLPQELSPWAHWQLTGTAVLTTAGVVGCAVAPPATQVLYTCVFVTVLVSTQVLVEYCQYPLPPGAAVVIAPELPPLAGPHCAWLFASVKQVSPDWQHTWP